ncbi:fatty acid desaturase family protein [Pseudomonas sp. B6002]|uniref:fatty acid desaturase family protein n=1 Tax=Pseudomonas sp. B6002 TaxID=2726978 RepID=UPI0015A079B1|nr:fatty acid desaturase family protein [Pseudomonas sp. B6002]NVZ51827.1 fatty acid desaturase family protein [Pseudomonas sp. B6002]
MLVDQNKEAAGEYAAGISRETFGMLKHLCKKDNYHWAVALGKDYAIIAFAIYLSLGISYWFYPVSLFLIGTTQRALANVLHESAHKMLAKNRFINWFSGTFLSGYLIFHLHQSYSISHIKNHHVHLGHPEKDPDYNFHLKCGLYDVKQSEREFFLKNVLLALSGYRTVQYIRYIIKDRVKAQGSDKKIRNERLMLWTYWAAIFAVAASFGVVTELLLFWLVPLFTTAVAVGWIIELAEHYPLPAAETEKLLLTRNRKGNALENFFFGRHDDNYHLVHHLHPAIPHWNMRKAHELLMSHPEYARWDNLWAGIFTRDRHSPNKETMLSYAAKFRAHKIANHADDSSFARRMLNQAYGV